MDVDVGLDGGNVGAASSVPGLRVIGERSAIVCAFSMLKALGGSCLAAIWSCNAFGPCNGELASSAADRAADKRRASVLSAGAIAIADADPSCSIRARERSPSGRSARFVSSSSDNESAQLLPRLRSDLVRFIRLPLTFWPLRSSACGGAPRLSPRIPLPSLSLSVSLSVPISYPTFTH